MLTVINADKDDMIVLGLCTIHIFDLAILLPRSFTPYLNLVCFTNPFLHSLSGSIWTAFTDLGLEPD